MQKRNCRIEVRLTKAEYAELARKAKSARLSMSGFVRRAVADKEIKAAPPANVPMLIREVRRVGYNIDQILKRANAGGVLDVPMLRRALEENREVERLIFGVYTMGEG